MYLNKIKKGDIYMKKIRIINIQKFIISVFILLITILSIFILFSNSTLSHGELAYVISYVSAGDTLWKIAKEEQKNNKYYEGKDIRYILNDLKNINHLKTSSLSEGQKLEIPKIEKED